jgi:hypothetical protein
MDHQTNLYTYNYSAVALAMPGARCVGYYHDTRDGNRGM